MQYEQRLAQWRAEVPYGVDVKPKGNSITQKYYTKRLLPSLIATLHKHYNDPEHPEYKNYMLQEDNDGSHGTRSKVNIAQEMKEKAHIKVLNHPPQSPDLNPIKGIWNIFKQRIRKRYHEWKTYKQLKAIAIKEWDEIQWSK